MGTELFTFQLSGNPVFAGEGILMNKGYFHRIEQQLMLAIMIED